ncbi:hypothetical protein BD289DRAFT_475089 [Coniella lustricola]|uniref:Uncharacterized protein n=1 Tax=Coniella lustricola TaxID=2025994 RepID=A0A2T3A4G4_9PEZI|nr:hypothetical protein BD289DRAFT_475089 [Coniella lustricola]
MADSSCFNTELVIYSFADTFADYASLYAGDPIDQMEVLIPGYEDALPECNRVYSSPDNIQNSAMLFVDTPTCQANSSAATTLAFGDCFTICQDPATLFLPFNFLTCLSLGMAAMLLQNGTFYLNESQKDTAQSIQDFEIGNLTTWDGTAIVQNTVDCLVASCSENSLGQCTDTLVSLKGANVSVDDLATVSLAFETYCENVQPQYNSDIAGPGVMLSYQMQVAAAMAFWVVMKLFRTWLRTLAWPFLLITTKAPFIPKDQAANHTNMPPKQPGRTRTAWSRAKDMQKSIRRNRLHATIVLTLVEFQETQSFFIGAIQIATLVTFRSGLTSGVNNDPINSFQEAISDNQMVLLLGIYGIIPNVLVQVVLRDYDRRGWYLLALLWINTILAFIVDKRRNELTTSFDTAFNVLKKQGTISACGDNPNPMTYCNAWAAGFFPSASRMVVGYCAVVILTINRLLALLCRKSFWRKRVAKLGIAWYFGQHKWLRILVKTCLIIVRLGWIVLESCLLYLTIIYMSVLAGSHWVGMDTTDPSQSAWTFGQLIAVLVWLPIATKFVYFILFGVNDAIAEELNNERGRGNSKQPASPEDSTALLHDSLEMDELLQKPDISQPAPTEARYKDLVTAKSSYTSLRSW